MKTRGMVTRSTTTAGALAVTWLVINAAATTAGKSSVSVTNPIAYMDDAPYIGHPCSGDSSVLHYRVFYPSEAATYPVVFTFQGAGFHSVSDCDPDTGRDKWLSMDNEAATWAANGFVAVNVEYHGLDTSPGLYGDSTCPTPDCRRSAWGSAADGYIERNLKRAVSVFFQRHPLSTYGADESKGLIAFGGSAGAHGAYMLAITNVGSDHPFDAAIGWSGMGDIAQAGLTALTQYEDYMDGQPTSPLPGSDQFDFGSPKVRLQSRGPALYIANGQFEFVDPASAQGFYDECAEPRVPRCWFRLVDSDQHATGYENYSFHGPTDPDEITVPQARPGVTVFQDSVCFAHRVLGVPDQSCP